VACIARLQDNKEYRTALAEERQAEQALAAATGNNRINAAQRIMYAKTAIKRIESQAIASDPNAIEAEKGLQVARAAKPTAQPAHPPEGVIRSIQEIVDEIPDDAKPTMSNGWDTFAITKTEGYLNAHFVGRSIHLTATIEDGTTAEIRLQGNPADIPAMWMIEFLDKGEIININGVPTRVEMGNEGKISFWGCDDSLAKIARNWRGGEKVPYKAVITNIAVRGDARGGVLFVDSGSAEPN
jgi:hypothetical protein